MALYYTAGRRHISSKLVKAFISLLLTVAQSIQWAEGTPEGRGRAGNEGPWFWPPSVDDKEPGRCLSIPHRVGSALERNKRCIKNNFKRRDKHVTMPQTNLPLTFQRGVSKALGARRPSRECVCPHVGGRDGGGSIPRRQLGLRLEDERSKETEEKQIEGRKRDTKPEEVSLFHPFSIIHKQRLWSRGYLALRLSEPSVFVSVPRRIQVISSLSILFSIPFENLLYFPFLFLFIYLKPHTHTTLVFSLSLPSLYLHPFHRQLPHL